MCERVKRIKLVKLYSKPSIFDEIQFHDGVNIILGEKSEDIKKTKKTNGVGKSICVEFINFCLLKEFNNTRLSKISSCDLDYNTAIFLDIEIDDKFVTIKRTLANYDFVEIVIDKEVHKFDKLISARDFLSGLIFNGFFDVTYRQLISSVTREEKIDYKSILSYYASKRIPDDPTVLLFMFELDRDKIRKVYDLQKDYESKNSAKGETKKNLEKISGLSYSEIKSSINEKQSILSSSLSAVQKIEADAVYKSIERELVDMESVLSDLHTQRVLLKTKINQIESMPKPEEINYKDLKDTYNFFKNGLGDYIEKSLEEVVSFKNVVEKYQQTLVFEKLKEYRSSLKKIESKIRNIQADYTSKLNSIKFEHITGLEYITNSVKTVVQLQNEVNDIKVLYDLYIKLDLDVREIKTQYTVALNELNKNLADLSSNIASFENDIVDFHKFVMNDGHCSFAITLDEKIGSKKLVNIDLRITDDGSYSVDRIKMFLFDIALMLNENTRKSHPKFIIHDNIFQMDKDSFEKCIKLIIEKTNEYSDFQYITTLNADDIENSSISDVIKERNLVVARFTKTAKFLKMDYTELSS